MTAETGKLVAKKPDVTKPGVLPPPQHMARRDVAEPTQTGAVVPAGGVPAATPAPVAPTAASSPGASGFAKVASRFEKKTPATEMAVAWQNRIAYLPDPSRNGAPGAGVVGQLFLFGGPKLQFAEADGTLTVDLIDETPRPAGQKGAEPERWQFTKELLKNLRTVDETFGKSYVLFLPWPAYKPDITRVRISARYDPDSGHTLYAQPSVITIDSTPHGTPVWDGVTQSTPLTPGATINRPAQASSGAPGALPGLVQPGVPNPGMVGAIPLGPQPNTGKPLSVPLSPATPASGNPQAIPPASMSPPGLGPAAPPPPPGLAPIAITIGKP